MQTFIERYIEQGEQRGEQRDSAAVLLRQIERKFGSPSETVRHRITEADSETLLEWSERILDQDTRRRAALKDPALSDTLIPRVFVLQRHLSTIRCVGVATSTHAGACEREKTAA